MNGDREGSEFGGRHSTYARYICRVGALAVALGVTGAVAAPSGVAWADDSPSATDDGSPPSDTGEASSPDTLSQVSSGFGPTSTAAGSRSTDGPGAEAESPTLTPSDDSGVIVRSSGGALTSTGHTSQSDMDPSVPGGDEDPLDDEAAGVAADETPPGPDVDQPDLDASGAEPTVEADADQAGGEPTSDGAIQTSPEATNAVGSKSVPPPGNANHDESDGIPVALTGTPAVLISTSDHVEDPVEAAPPRIDTRVSLVPDATAAVSTAQFPFIQLPTPVQFVDQIRDTLTSTFTKCACALFSGVAKLVETFSSLMAPAQTAPTPSVPTDPAQAPLLWTVAAWVRRQVDYVAAAFNRSPIGQLVHQVSERVIDTVTDLGNSPLGRQFSASLSQFLAECEGSTSLRAELDRTTVVSGLNEPTDFAILTAAGDPDEIYRILVIEKSGAVKSYDPTSGQLTTLVSLPVVTAAGERGLIGVEVDPHFWTQGEEGYRTIYVAYTGADNYDRLSSLLVNDAFDGVEETELVRSDQPAREFHHGGDLAFDPEGRYLYWAVGNNTDNANSQDLSTIHGKLLRLNRDGTAPTDNPFVDDPTAEPLVYAYGFRNPFRFTFTPDGKILVGDVGEATWEELNLVTAGANYGWPNAEGPCDGCGYVNPIYAYRHAGAVTNAGAITSVVVYTGDTYPEEYRNKVFIADYSLGWIKELTFDSEYTSLIGERTLDSGAGAVVKLAQGPDGNIYQLNIYPGTLSVLTPSGGNRTPTGVIAASATSGAGDSLTVHFSASDSRDPDGDALTYHWDFGDGRTSADVDPTVVFTNDAEYTAYTVTLTVSDGQRQSATTQRIVVGSTPPDAEIVVSSGKYNAGDTIEFSADAFDLEDGTLPDSAYQWRVEFRHADHQHPFRDGIVGPAGAITIPRNSDQMYNTFYRIVLTVTDRSGLSTTRSVDVTPNLVTLTFGANQPGATYTIDGIPHQGLYSEQAVVGVQRSLNVPSPQYVGGQQLEFGSWSDGGAQSHVIVTPGANTSYQVTFAVAASAATVLT